MAKPRSSSVALKKLEDQLTCPICLDHLTDPKTLPCLHSFCQDCLQGVPLDLVQSADKYLLTCPTCRSSSELPQTGVAGLPTAFLINNLSEVYGLLKKVSTTRDVSCDKCKNKTNATGYCKKCGLFYCQECLSYHKKLKLTSDHEIVSVDEVANAAYQPPAVKADISKCSSHDKPLDIYCETCEDLVCQHCTVHVHKDHEYDTVSNAYQKHRQALEAGALQPLKDQVVRILEALAEMMQRRNEITQQGEEVKEDIRTTTRHLIEQLHKTERQLTEEVDEAVRVKMGVINRQVKNAETALDQLRECLNYVEQGLKVGTPQQILSAKAQMKNQSKCIVSHVEKDQFDPLEQADIKLKKSKQINNIPNNIGSLHYSFLPSEVSVLKERLPLVGRKSTCTFSFSSSNGSPASVPFPLISCYLTPIDSQQTIEYSLKESRKPGEYEVAFTPITRGLHQLYVRVGGSNIPGSPVSIPVSVPPEKRRGTSYNFITGLKGPFGVDVTEEGQVIVNEYDRSRITILNKEGKKIRSFGSRGAGRGQFNCPIGIAIAANGNVLVVDCGNNRIQQFTMEGQCVSSVGSKGTGPLQFNNPRGIAVNKITCQVFVADSGNHRIQVLNPNLSFSHMFGNNGSKEGQFNDPWDLTVDDTGTVFVADTFNHRIQQFTSEGRFVSMFNTNTNYPAGITSFDGILYASQHGNDHCLSMYTTSGEYLSSIGGKDDPTLQLRAPQHVTLDTTGHLYLCDYYNSRVLIF